MATILVRNASYFDGVGDELRPGTNILVVDGRIEAVSDRPIPVRSGIEFDIGAERFSPV